MVKNDFHICGEPSGSVKYREPLKNNLKRENQQSAPDARKADEARLYVLRGGMTQQTEDNKEVVAVAPKCGTDAPQQRATSAIGDFTSNRIFVGDILTNS